MANAVAGGALIGAAAVLPMLLTGRIADIGTARGSGCTSGHGVCGLARLSRRSLAATVTFMAVAALTVLLDRHVF